MNCMHCGSSKINPHVTPFGGYFCKNNHAQCEQCNELCHKHCAECGCETLFCKMILTDKRLDALNLSKAEQLQDATMPATAAVAAAAAAETEAAIATPVSAFRFLPSTSSLSALNLLCEENSAVKFDSKLKQQQIAENMNNNCDIWQKAEEEAKRLKQAEQEARKQSMYQHYLELEDKRHAELAALAKDTYDQNLERLSAELGKLTPPDERIQAGAQILFDMQDAEINYFRQNLLRKLPEHLHELANVYQKTLDVPNDNDHITQQVRAKLERVHGLERMQRLLHLTAETEKLSLLKMRCGVSGSENKQEYNANAASKTLEPTLLQNAADNLAAKSQSDAPEKFIEKRLENLMYNIEDVHIQDNVPSLIDGNRKHLNVDMSKDCDSDTITINFEEKIVKTPNVLFQKQQAKAAEQCFRVRRKNLAKSTPLQMVQQYMTRIRRANCVPFNMTVKPVECMNKVEYRIELPQPQSTPVMATEEEIIETLAAIKKRIFREKCQSLYISRAPIHCPDVDCRRIAFISDLNHHLIYDHAALTMERIRPKQVKSFFLDVNVVRNNSPKCHMLYLLRDKNIDLGYNELSNLLPIMVMCTKVHLLEVCTQTDAEASSYNYDNPKDLVFLLWLTGLVPDNTEISATVSLWPLNSKYIKTHTVRTGFVYSIRSPQNVRSIYTSNAAVHLAWDLVQSMTNNGEDMFGIQVIIH